MVETTHPGNIGAAARAMKAMGLSRLYLVKPSKFPSVDVTARAAGADDVLSSAVVCETLQDALKDCVFIVGTSARGRSIPWPTRSPRECAQEIITESIKGEVAVVFGRESSGLTNIELEFCNQVIQIPTDPDFSSLNIASAIQIICYEIRLALLSNKPPVKNSEDIPEVTNEQMNLFYEHLESCMTNVGYHDPDIPRSLMRRLKRLFNRARLDRDELNILRGFLTAIQEKLKK